jgi:serine phosphatase RsbU (regulator of sigma subunit)
VGLWKEITANVSLPAEILLRLNRQLEGSVKGGFVTCLCTRLASDGRLTMANAGHLAPYLNGMELKTNHGLPLGITLQSDYEESNHVLSPDGMLVFVSDGVVEARDKRRSLFGFERLQQTLSEHLKADAIARCAQQFGQEDDITVITISRQAVAAEPAMQSQTASIAV